MDKRTEAALTKAQRAVLESARAYGMPTRHLSGRSAHGGFVKTVNSLIRRELLDRYYQITAVGRAALSPTSPAREEER